MSVKIVDFRPSGEYQWTQQARCSKTSASVMFPHDGDAAGIEYAKSLCAECPVRAQCLADALEHGEQWGIWGGLTTNERKKLNRRRKTTLFRR